MLLKHRDKLLTDLLYFPNRKMKDVFTNIRQKLFYSAWNVVSMKYSSWKQRKRAGRRSRGSFVLFFPRVEPQLSKVRVINAILWGVQLVWSPRRAFRKKTRKVAELVLSSLATFAAVLQIIRMREITEALRDYKKSFEAERGFSHFYVRLSPPAISLLPLHNARSM